MSLLRRHRLIQELQCLAAEEAFHRAATEDDGSEVAAAELQMRIDAMAIRTALLAIEGLSIDGQAATVASVMESGPESLAHEIAEAIAEESSLHEHERKN